MEPENEFTKPLKARTEDAGKKRTRNGLIIAGVGLLFILPIFHFYDGFSRLGSLLTPEKPEPQIVVVEKTPEPAETEVAKNAEIPSRNHQLDPEKGEFQEVKPEGQINRITPQKPQPVSKNIKRQEVALAHLPDPELIERGATGVIPKRSNDGLRPMDVYSRRPDTQGNFGVARVVLVVGGLGISQTSTQQAIEKLPSSVTLAFAPYGNSLTRWMQQARKSGHELLLQVPMEPIDYPQNNPGPHTLRSEVDLQENLVNLHWSMSRITNYVGIMNYLGNKIMSEPAGLSPIFSEIAERGLLFFEDGTVNNSVAEGVAVKSLLPYAKGEFLLDNIRSRSAIAEKLNKLAEQAKRTGLAVGVGNAFPDTIALVAEFARRAKENGIEITPVSSIVRDPSR